MKQALLVCLVAAALAVTSGCGVCYPMRCGPYGANAVSDCGEGPCQGPGCGPLAGLLAGPRCAQACGPAGGPGDAPCGDCGSCAGQPCRPCGPLAWLFGVFTEGTYCGSGCGELYRGPFHDDLPDCRDPCDCHGNWIGRRCGGCAGCAGGDCGNGGCANGNCASCASGDSARVKSAGSSYVKGKSSPARQAYVRSDSQSPYAPRIISQSERVVSPATSGQSAWQAAQPRQTTEQR